LPSFLPTIPCRFGSCRTRCSRPFPRRLTCAGISLQWNGEGLPGSWGVLSCLCPAHETPAAPYRLAPNDGSVLPPIGKPRRPQLLWIFRGCFTRLQHSLSTLPDSAFPTLARLAPGGRLTLAGWDLNPLDSNGEFQEGLPPPIPTPQASPGAISFILKTFNNPKLF
jgi:hypothetical protein